MARPLVFALLLSLPIGCASSMKPGSSGEAPLKNQVAELKNTIRLQNERMEELSQKVILLGSPSRRVAQDDADAPGDSELPGVSLADPSDIDESEIMRGPTVRLSGRSPVDPERLAETAGSGMTVQLVPRGKRSAGAPAPAKAPDRAPKPEETYFEAVREIRRGNRLEKGRERLQGFVKKFPGHVLADDAYYRLGKLFLLQREYERAVFHFKRMLELYPDGDKVVSGCYELGLALKGLKREAEAREILRSLTVRYPGSREALLAEQALQGQASGGGEGRG